MAQNAFLHETRDTGDGARSEPESVMSPSQTGSIPRRDRNKRPKSAPRSRNTSAGTAVSRGRQQPSKSRDRSQSRPRARVSHCVLIT
jgi:hypothetical protein